MVKQELTANFIDSVAIEWNNVTAVQESPNFGCLESFVKVFNLTDTCRKTIHEVMGSISQTQKIKMLN